MATGPAPSSDNVVDAPLSPVLTLDRPIVLVGLMGVGKTTIGRRLAQRLSLPFVDADEEIESAAGMTISDIFERYGEPHFRDGERRVIARLIDGLPKVIATGGGAFMNDETRALIKERSISVWLKADLDVLVRRVSRKDSRPLLSGKDPLAILTELAEKRYPVYAQADIMVETGDTEMIFTNPRDERTQDYITGRFG